jgi:hypothetical protein
MRESLVVSLVYEHNIYTLYLMCTKTNENTHSFYETIVVLVNVMILICWPLAGLIEPKFAAHAIWATRADL